MPKLSSAEFRIFSGGTGCSMRIAVVAGGRQPAVQAHRFLSRDGDLVHPRKRGTGLPLRRDSGVALCIDEQAMRVPQVAGRGDARNWFSHRRKDDVWRDLYRRIAGTSPRRAAAYIRNTINKPRGLYRLPWTG